MSNACSAGHSNAKGELTMHFKTKSRYSFSLVLLLSLGNYIQAEPYIMGQYKGEFYPDSVSKMNATCEVVNEGDGRYRIAIHANQRNVLQNNNTYIELHGKKTSQSIAIADRFGGYDWNGEIKDGILAVKSAYGQHIELKKIESKSTRAGMKPPEEAIILLPYQEGKKPDMSCWTNTEWKALDDGSIEIVPGKGPNKTKQLFDDIKFLHLEFKLPLESKARGQSRANGGVFICDAYEVQILDSFGVIHTSGDCGAIYNVARASVNACLPPETWQSLDVMFRAPRLDQNGKAKSSPQITVYLNSVRIHKDLEIPNPQDRERGPIRIEDEGHRIQFRNIWIVE